CRSKRTRACDRDLPRTELHTEAGTGGDRRGAYTLETSDRSSESCAAAIHKDREPNAGMEQLCRCRQGCATIHRDRPVHSRRPAQEMSRRDSPNILVLPVPVPVEVAHQASGALTSTVDCDGGRHWLRSGRSSWLR